MHSSPDAEFNDLVPDPQIAKELSVSLMTIWRWDQDPELAELGWPPPIYIRKRKYRPRKQFEKFKGALLRRAIHTRGQRVS
jgi:hypothetical protein